MGLNSFLASSIQRRNITIQEYSTMSKAYYKAFRWTIKRVTVNISDILWYVLSLKGIHITTSCLRLALPANKNVDSRICR